MNIWPIISKIFFRIPEENPVKQFLIKVFYTYHNPLYSSFIKDASLLPNGELFVELDNGMKFYGKPDPAPLDSYDRKYARRDKLSKFKSVEIRKFSFLSSLTEIFFFNRYERYYNLKKGDTVVDAGAHFGVFTCKAAKIVGDGGEVIAIEPEESNVELLQRNIKMNNLTNVIVIQRALWSRKDRIKFHLSSDSRGHSVFTGEDNFVTIEADTLDNILEELKVDKVDFIKMNIEGAEIEALKGMGKTLRNKDVKLAIEAYHKIEGSLTYKAVTSYLKELGFKAPAYPFIYASKAKRGTK